MPQRKPKSVPNTPIVRRARKSLRERRMRECLRELTTNLEKVETRTHLHNKRKRMIRRKIGGELVEDIPAAVRRGVMDADLFKVECDLHAAAGIAPPVPLHLQLAQQMAQQRKIQQQQERAGGLGGAGGDKMIGIIPFAVLARQVRQCCKV